MDMRGSSSLLALACLVAACGGGQDEPATCDDNGPDVGVSFPEKPRQVPVRAYDGVDPDIAIGVRDATGDFVVLVAEGVSKSKAQRIADRLK